MKLLGLGIAVVGTFAAMVIGFCAVKTKEIRAVEKMINDGITESTDFESKQKFEKKIETLIKIHGIEVVRIAFDAYDYDYDGTFFTDHKNNKSFRVGLV